MFTMLWNVAYFTGGDITISTLRRMLVMRKTIYDVSVVRRYIVMESTS